MTPRGVTWDDCVGRARLDGDARGPHSLGTEEIDMSAITTSPLRRFGAKTLRRGRVAEVECVEIGGQVYTIRRGPVTVVQLHDEWYEDVRDPERVIETLRDATDFKADIFTFWQRVPDLDPRYPYPVRSELVAGLPITTYGHWYDRQIGKTTRNRIRKSERAGVEVRECAYDDAFVGGMAEIFNETPIRQGRPFWHYGKSVETVRREFSRFLFREELLGAYLGEEMIGFAMLGRSDGFADLGQVISKLRHRDKAVNNALVAKVVNVCARQQIPHLVYGSWDGDSLGKFKQYCGFERLKVPRYVVPLSLKGRLALRIGAYGNLRDFIPMGARTVLKKLRRQWYRFYLGGVVGSLSWSVASVSEAVPF
jgi:hypothetical protein